MAQALGHRRQQVGVDRGDAKRRVALPEHTVGAVVLPTAGDVAIAVTGTGAGDCFPRHLVGGLLQRADLFLVEDAAQHQQSVPMELVDLLLGEHGSFSPYLVEIIPTISASSCHSSS